MLALPLTTATIPSLTETELEDLLSYLKRVSQVSLRGYKRPSLLRRIQVRMQRIEAKHYQDYFDYLQQHPTEVTQLLNTIYINVTAFFRDRPVWDCLKNQVIPQIIANKAPEKPIRVWSAGGASGEEAYSLAMLLAEALGIEQFQKRVRIYGTDIDHDAILQARRGYYPAATVEEIAPALLERYFEQVNDGYQWQRDLRRSLIFQPHDLIQTPPMAKIDLLVCRNTLMYFTTETQLRALVRFHFSLQQDGFLLLGRAEHLVNHLQTSLFTSIDQQARLFKKVPGAHRNSRLLPIAFRSYASTS